MEPQGPYASRGGLKLAAALDAFKLDLNGAICADLGCSTGGFTDCMLQHGAKRVYAVDTAYGQLAWKLRQDGRVVVLERTNALHFDPAMLEGFAGCDLVTIDMSWTRQKLAVPAALRWLRGEEASGGRIITLIKPHYEQAQDKSRGRGEKKGGSRGGVLDETEAQAILEKVLSEMDHLGVTVLGCMASPIRGGAKGGRGNVEYLAMGYPFNRSYLWRHFSKGGSPGGDPSSAVSRASVEVRVARRGAVEWR